MKFFPLLFIAMFSPLLLCGQYVTEKGELRKDLIIEELQSFDNGGGYQNRKREEILRALLKAKKNHPVLQKTKKKRDRVSLTIMQIDNKSGEFSFLRGNHYIDKEVDTLSLEVILLKEDLMAYKD